MTSSAAHNNDESSVTRFPRLETRDQRIAREVRAEMGRQKPYGITQERVALEVFGENQQWLQRRINGKTPFTAGELLAIADFLRTDVVQFLAAGKHPQDPSENRSWAPWDSNPQPTDYEADVSNGSNVIPLRARRAS